MGADVKSKKFLSANRGCEENLGVRLNLFCSGTNIHFRYPKGFLYIHCTWRRKYAEINLKLKS